MRHLIFGSLLALVVGATAHAQDFGIIAGLSESNATASQSGFSSSGEFVFRVGGVASFSLMDNLKFRTGLIYSQRHFDLKDGSGNKSTDKFDYLDVPVLAQYNFNDMVGIFGGLIAAVNVNHSIDSNSGAVATGTKGLYPLLQAGFNVTFDNMYGVEIYYEAGLGDIYDGAKNFSVFGANFIYWL